MVHLDQGVGSSGKNIFDCEIFSVKQFLIDRTSDQIVCASEIKLNAKNNKFTEFTEVKSFIYSNLFTELNTCDFPRIVVGFVFCLIISIILKQLAFFFGGNLMFINPR